MKHLRPWLFGILLFSLCSLHITSHAQVDGGLSSAVTSKTNYYFGRPNELTIMVNVLGSVQRPGRYEISTSIDLIDLLALAGGPTEDGMLDDVKITSPVKTDSGIMRRELRVNLDEMSEVRLRDLVLHQGDIVQVGRSGLSTFRDVLSIATSIAVITVAVVNVVYLVRD